MRWLAVLSLSSLTSAGCALSYPHLTLATQMRIEADTRLDDLPSGHASEGDATVRVIANGAFCSGVVVGEDLVITAQHCVMQSLTTPGSAEMAPSDVRIELGGGALPWGRVGVRAVERCAGYDKVHAAFDVAVLVLDAPLPADVPELRLRQDGPREDEVLYAQGFGTGMTSYVLPDFESHDAPHPMVAWSTTRVSRSGTLVWSSDDSFVGAFSSAHGDSGGPIVGLDGALLGVASLRVETHDGKDEKLTIGARIDACEDMMARARNDANMP